MDDAGSAPEPEQAGVAAVTVERQQTCGPLGAVRPVTGVVRMSGKAPPSPEMTLSGLTESGLSGKIISPKIDFPRLCRTCGPPLRRAVSFLGSCLQRLSANHFAPSGIRHRSHSAVK